jgi:hypothetical protein
MIYQTGGPPACTGEWTVSVAAAGSQFTGTDQGRNERAVEEERALSIEAEASRHGTARAVVFWY